MIREFPVYLEEKEDGSVVVTITYGAVNNQVYRELKERHNLPKNVAQSMTVTGLTWLVKNVINRFTEEFDISVESVKEVGE